MNETPHEPTGRPDEAPAGDAGTTTPASSADATPTAATTPPADATPAPSVTPPADSTPTAAGTWAAPTGPAVGGPAAPTAAYATASPSVGHGAPAGSPWPAPATDAFGRPMHVDGAGHPVPPKRMGRGLRTGLIAGASALALLLAFGSGTAVGFMADLGRGSSEAGQSRVQDPGSFVPSQGHGRGMGGTGQGSSGSGTQRGSGSGTGTSATSPEASAEQIAGVVTVDSALTYENAAGAGTGIILSSDGTILTNNHVVSGATSIRVTVESTGKAYVAKVVGTDATNDVAVLKLEGASGLTPAKIDTDGVQVGEAVTGVGNAGGTGTLTAASGSVTALGQSVTTQSEGTAAGETLTDLIQTDAPIVSGDSGGPLKDADGEVVGIDTAASSGSADITGFAIPIDRAMSIAKQIESGVESGTVKIGYPAFLGVLLANQPGTVAGAPLSGVVDGSGAAKAGLAQGDVVTSVDGKPVSSASELSTAVSGHKPGDRVKLGWTTAAGAQKTAEVTLTEGPVS
ncbi:Periplasmic pH-dependent serine endoprotease DegQ precursor [Clavibacter michiganensis]|uniref:Periplasmic pH-dependent serine endoprotease DegQ n=1 Tax=Clavibacter michiganensis TaxID=28447 RepID=A0A251YGB9_9MICO|nr:trypsin-like peptidase domain-containing protein [Clavibacter michiganensis]OUE23236.1 Periplasmic pH-dependent serine endoprotease DegQ precursor [Clavibacter michiganensis]